MPTDSGREGTEALAGNEVERVQVFLGCGPKRVGELVAVIEVELV
jgi:hypothetical protein